MAEKVTMMMLKVDLNCSKCYKKVKKALRKFPQEIRDELFDEKSNTIIIKVVCYDPERFMNKLCSKGDGSIKSIVILEPPKPPQVQAQASQKPKEPEKPPAPAPAPARPPAPTPQMMPMSHAYHCGPYYEAQQFSYYGRPIYDSWGGGPHPHSHYCHEVSNQQSCSIM
ncbi:unnamed protein product [Microthlaspi erraticum]|uniref:HMA domain-containing protein n=1 Tax=Microthlaspi erraticum TaxID=1685480 RepID=A0A6D2KLI9_9BRAS|nr:unnamed protein product [Microthlaspi erraticum]